MLVERSSTRRTYKPLTLSSVAQVWQCRVMSETSSYCMIYSISHAMMRAPFDSCNVRLEANSASVYQVPTDLNAAPSNNSHASDTISASHKSVCFLQLSVNAALHCCIHVSGACLSHLIPPL